MNRAADLEALAALEALDFKADSVKPALPYVARIDPDVPPRSQGTLAALSIP